MLYSGATRPIILAGYYSSVTWDVHSVQCNQLQNNDGSPAASVRQDNEEEPDDELEVANGRDRSGFARLADADEHPRVQNRYEHQPEAGGRAFETESDETIFLVVSIVWIKMHSLYNVPKAGRVFFIYQETQHTQ